MAEIAAPPTRRVAPAAAGDMLVLEPLEDTLRGRIRLWEIARIALDSLIANKIRTLLTMLGIIIGVAAVIALLAIGEGVRIWVTSSFAQSGTNSITVAGRNLSLQDVAAIEALGLPLEVIAPQYSAEATIVAPATDESASIVGVTPAYAQAQNLTLTQGTFFTEAQVDEIARVMVLGSALAEDLFGEQALGQTVRVEGQSFQIIGVLEEQGGGPFGSVDEQALVPISVVHRRLFGGRTSDGNDFLVQRIQIVAADRDDLTTIQTQVSRLLRKQHYLAQDGSEDDFRVFNQAAMIEQLNGILTALTIFLAAVAGLSLLVGGLGIMNIMLVSVTERTREIGLRKAVGGHRSDILLQFLVEAVLMSVLGGLIGLTLGGGIALLITTLSPITAPVSFWSVVLAVGFAAVVGIFFGIYPAQQAARLDPITALRHE